MAKVALSGMLGNAAGGYSGMVVSNTRSGLVLRRKPQYRRPTSPGQLAAAQRMKRASEAWAEFTAEQAQAWNRYGATIERSNHTNGTHYTSTGFNAFIALTLKVLQVNEAAEIPQYPPVECFIGDSILVSYAGTSGQLVFTATGPNAPGTVTELLVQKLPNQRRAPTQHYVTAAFAHFEAGSLSYALDLEPGYYVAAWRFVDSATGQTTSMLRGNMAHVS